MLNLNSPIVQAMLANTPNGVGNIPTYYGNAPTHTTETLQTPSEKFKTPFPSPKEMLTNDGVNRIYPNSGFQAAFAGYNNPYMNDSGYGYKYNPYTGGTGTTYYGSTYYPIDEETREHIQVATDLGIDYRTHIENQSELNKKMVKLAGAACNRTPEEIEILQKNFDVYEKSSVQVYDCYRDRRKFESTIAFRVVVNDEVVVEHNCGESANQEQKEQNVLDARFAMFNNKDYALNGIRADQFRDQNKLINNIIQEKEIQMYNSAIERKYDNIGLAEYFNEGAASELYSDALKYMAYKNKNKCVSKLYDKKRFKERLKQDTQVQSKSQQEVANRFFGRYGVMPDGRPTGPGSNPAVASSFSYNPVTQTYDIVAPTPKLLSDYVEDARQRFISMI